MMDCCKCQISFDNSVCDSQHQICENSCMCSNNCKVPDLITANRNKAKERNLVAHQVKRSYSQNWDISISRQSENPHNTSKRVLVRKTKSLNDVPNCEIGFWNWQLEGGKWSEVMDYVPLDIETEIYSKEQRESENPEIYIVNASSSGKK